MKFSSSILSFLATALPMMLVQHATPASAAALCIPGVYCPQSSPAPAPACTYTDGGAPPPASSTATSDPTFTSVPASSSTSHTHSTVTVTVTTTPTASVASASDTATSTSDSSSDAARSSLGGGQQTATTTITVTGAPQPTSGTSCSTGPVQCCDSIQPSSGENASQVLGLLGVVLQGANVPVGLNCIPIDVIGGGSAGTCNAQAVCCENNSFQGLVNIGCSPINIGL